MTVATRQEKKCVECKSSPVRKPGSELCRKCFRLAMLDTFRNEKP